MTTSASSSILSTISQIRKRDFFCGGEDKDGSGINPCRLEFDNVMRLIYLHAGIHPVCLDRGADLEQGARGAVKRGSAPGDVIVQLLDKKLGGRSYINNGIPVNPKTDISAWKNSVDVIYDHVKQGGDCHAQMQFAFEYNNEPENREVGRPVTLCYHFVLYKEDVQVGAVMEGRIENPNPRRILPEFKIVYE